MSKHHRILLGFLLLRGVTVLAVLGAAFAASLQRPARAEESFPWCVQGETLHYATGDQCELTVNYHGFCVAKSLCAAAASAAQLCPINPSALRRKN
jgi:hypothetical protein